MMNASALALKVNLRSPGPSPRAVRTPPRAPGISPGATPAGRGVLADHGDAELNEDSLIPALRELQDGDIVRCGRHRDVAVGVVEVHRPGGDLVSLAITRDDIEGAGEVAYPHRDVAYLERQLDLHALLRELQALRARGHIDEHVGPGRILSELEAGERKGRSENRVVRKRAEIDAKLKTPWSRFRRQLDRALLGRHLRRSRL